MGIYSAANATPPAPTVVVTPGYLSTEFYLTIAGSLIAILNSAFGWHIPSDTILQVVGGIAAYVLGRSIAKKPADTATPAA